MTESRRRKLNELLPGMQLTVFEIAWFAFPWMQSIWLKENNRQHITDSEGNKVRMNTENWTPLTPKDVDAYNKSPKIKKFCESLSDAEKKFLDRVNRQVFHKGAPTVPQAQRIGERRGGWGFRGRGEP
jgi:hypothetical protein